MYKDQNPCETENEVQKNGATKIPKASKEFSLSEKQIPSRQFSFRSDRSTSCQSTSSLRCSVYSQSTLNGNTKPQSELSNATKSTVNKLKKVVPQLLDVEKEIKIGIEKVMEDLAAHEGDKPRRLSKLSESKVEPMLETITRLNN